VTATVSPALSTWDGHRRGTTPEAQAALAQQHSGERSPDLSTAREDIGAPPAPPATPPDEPRNDPNSPEGTGGTAGVGTGAPAGEASGTGAPGAGAGDSGDAGSPGDYARGGRVARRSGVGGSFKNAKRFATGGSVPTSYYERGGSAGPTSAATRLARIRAFEHAHANTPV
jgi:hypothetical protein